MKTVYSTLVFAALAVGAVTASAAAKTDLATPRGESFCLMGEGEERCGFTSYAQCQASASGLGAECTIDLSADDRVRPMRARG